MRIKRVCVPETRVKRLFAARRLTHAHPRYLISWPMARGHGSGPRLMVFGDWLVAIWLMAIWHGPVPRLMAIRRIVDIWVFWYLEFDI